MMPEDTSQPLASTPAGGIAPSRQKFDPRTVAPFHERSVSEQTRRAYRRVVKEFFSYFKFRHPAEITSAEILAWRDYLHTEKKRSAATIALKLSVIRSMYDYLQLAGYLSTNPAVTKLVPPPSLPEDLRGSKPSAKWRDIGSHQ